jgi:hypothetical protein
METELTKLIRLIRRLIVWGICGFAGFWLLAYTWLAFNH